MSVVGNLDPRQTARAEQRGLRERVTTIGLHASARTLRNQRKRNRRAVRAERGDVSLKPTAAKPRLETERQLAICFWQSGRPFRHRIRAARDFADKASLLSSSAFGDRD